VPYNQDYCFTAPWMNTSHTETGSGGSKIVSVNWL